MPSAWTSLKRKLKPLKPLWDAWLVVVRAFSWVAARLVAVLLFVIGFVPYGIVMRIIRFDPLDRTGDRETYWKQNDHQNRSIDDFRKQY